VADVVVLGGSFCGLTTACLLADAGHRVTVLERDPPPPPEQEAAALEWRRPGTPQLRHSHALVGRGTALLERELPDVYAALLDADVHRIQSIDFLPPDIQDRAPRPTDDLPRCLTARRPVVDWVLGWQSAARRIDVVRTSARGLLVTDGRVVGVDADDQARTADLVVDASGRRSQVPAWLAAAGLSIEEETSPSGCMYLTRYYRLLPGAVPPPLQTGFSTSMPVDGFAALVFLGDGRTFSMSLQVEAHDKLLAQSRARFEDLLRVVPWTAPWVELGEPTGEVSVMAGITNTARHLRGVPGLINLGDAFATTNPTLGRGLSLSLIGSVALRDALGHSSSPLEWSEQLAEVRRTQVLPYVHEAWGLDERACAGMRARLYGEPLAGPGPEPLPEEVLRLVPVDRDAWQRAMLKNHLFEPPEFLYADAALRGRVLALRDGQAKQPPLVTREECLQAAGLDTAVDRPLIPAQPLQRVQRGARPRRGS